MELWDLYDKERIKTGETMLRGDDLPPNKYHVVVHICIFNSKNEMLIQKRQSFKKGWSNLWDVTAAGSAIANDTSQDAASRELFEELGLKIDFSNLRPNFTINFYRGFDDFYLIHKDDIELKDLKLQYEEVQDARWASKDEILKMIDDGLFIPYLKTFINFIFEVKDFQTVKKPK